MPNSVDLGQLASAEVHYTVCKGRAYPGSAGLGLKAKDTLCIYLSLDIAYAFAGIFGSGGNLYHH